MNSQPTAASMPAKPQVPLGDVILPDVVDDTPTTRRDFVDDSMFGVDDNVVLKNILDGTMRNGIKMPSSNYVFTWNGAQFRVKPGQVFSLPGARAYLYVKHIVSLIYRRVEMKPEMDKRSYPLNDKWVKEIVVQINKTLTPTAEDRNTVHDIPSYIAEDAQVDPETGLSGRLQNAMGQAGNGEVELHPVGMGDDATDDDIDNIPDFDESTSPKFKDENGEQIPAAPMTPPPAAPEKEFPDAKKPRAPKKETPAPKK